MQIDKETLVAGLDWNWSESVSSYPASTHTLKYILKKGTNDPITLTSAADGEAHEFTIDDALTSTYESGYYIYTAYVMEIADNDALTVIGTGVIEIKKDLATVSDARTHALTMVDNLRATIISLSTKTMSDVTIEGRSYTYNDIEKLEKLLKYYERQAGLVKRKRTLIQFSNT